MLPSLVYLTALVNIFTHICFNLDASPYKTRGIVSSIFVISSIGLSPSLPFVNAISSVVTLLKSYSVLTISNLPASIFDISKIPFTISRRLSLAITISFTSSLALSGKVLSSKSILLKPTIALSGVLISCDILDKNSVLAVFAFSAAIFASFNWAIILTSGLSIVKYIM